MGPRELQMGQSGRHLPSAHTPSENPWAPRASWSDSPSFSAQNITGDIRQREAPTIVKTHHLLTAGPGGCHQPLAEEALIQRGQVTCPSSHSSKDPPSLMSCPALSTKHAQAPSHRKALPAASESKGLPTPRRSIQVALIRANTAHRPVTCHRPTLLLYVTHLATFVPSYILRQALVCSKFDLEHRDIRPLTSSPLIDWLVRT